LAQPCFSKRIVDVVDISQISYSQMKVVAKILASLLAAALAYTPCDLQAEFDTVMCKSAACTNCDMEWCINKCVAWQEKYNRCRCRNWPCSRRCYNIKACPNEADAVPCTEPTLPPKANSTEPKAKELEGGPEKELEGENPEKELEKEVEAEEKPPQKEEAKKEEPKKAPEKEKWVDPWAHEGGDELEGEMMEEPEGGWGDEDDYYYDDYGDDDYGGKLDLHGRKVHTKLPEGHHKRHHHKGHHKGHHGHQGQPKGQSVSSKAFLSSSHLEA